jgi:pimeloyl-ACP methyl ester carboxylesterase
MSSYVLIHGAWSGAYRWKFVRPLLCAAGHEVFSPSLTGLGDRAHLGSAATNLSTHVQDIVNLVECEDLRDLVLVGHSYGGMPITGAADLLAERIAHLVYVDAFLPSDGQSCWDIGGGGARPAEGEWRIPPPNFARAQDAEPVRRFDQPAGTLAEPVRLTVPLEQRAFTRTYIKATADPRPEPPRRSAFYDAADRVSRDPAWRYIEMNAGHSIPWTHPKELVEILRSLRT